MEVTEIAFAVVGAVAAGGVMWGTMRTVVAGLRHDFKEHVREDKEHQTETRKTQLENVQRLARLETLVTEVHAAVVKESNK